MQSNAPTFRIRKNGQVIGPLPSTHVRLMARRGEIALSDEVSLNGGQWVPVVRTSLAREMPRKPAIVLQDKKRAPVSSMDDTLFAMPKLMSKPRPPGAPKSVAAPKPAASAAPAVPAPPPAPPQETDDPFADWGDMSSRTARHAARLRSAKRGGRKKAGKRGGFGMEGVLLAIFAVLAVVVIVAAAYRFGRGAEPPPVRSAAPAEQGPSAGASTPSEEKAFAGHAYALWEAEDAAAPAMRFRLLSDGRCETAGAAPAIAQKRIDRWRVTGGELLLLNDAGLATYRFPAQPELRELVGTFYGKKWRKLVRE